MKIKEYGLLFCPMDNRVEEFKNKCNELTQHLADILTGST